ncbi:hypothetical protein LXL04_039612 [Taraxacum kok-saghyz]
MSIEDEIQRRKRTTRNKVKAIMAFSLTTPAPGTTATATATATVSSSSSSLFLNPYPSQLSLRLNKFGSLSPKSFSVSCVLAKQSTGQMELGKSAVIQDGLSVLQRPDSLGRFGKYGGKYVPETLMFALSELESAFKALATDDEFQKELAGILKDYVGRESPLYFAERLTEHYKRDNGEGPEIYLKREDLNHTGAHKINNAVAQALLAKKLGKKRIIAETGAGQHGVATATVCARFGLECIIYMGAQDMERQALNVFRMKLLGAEVRPVHSGTATLKDATSEAIRDWVTNVETTHYILGSVAGPHPYPMMVRDFHAVIGKETRKQAMEKWGGKPDVLVACVGGGSNAMGLFHEFVEDTEVRMIGVEAAGFGIESGKHAATLTKGEVGVLHGAMSYLLQDDDGQIIEPHSISAGLDYPGVGPEHSFLKDLGRAEYYSITDEEALEAFKRLSRLEGIIPALETSHALAYLEKLCPTLPNGTKVVLNCSGRGDKDVHTAIKHLQASKSSVKVYCSLPVKVTVDPPEKPVRRRRRHCSAGDSPEKTTLKLQIEKFDGKDFSWWKMQIEDLLVQKDLDAVLGEKPEKMTQTEWETLDKKAKTFIRLALSKDVAFNILKETSAKGIMEALSNMYEKPSAANKVFLIRELVNTRMREGNSVTVHINNFNSILSRLGSVRIKFEDEVQALLLLSSLPDSWSGTVTAVTSSAGSKEFTFEGIRDLILGEDVRRRNSGESSSEQLNAVREVGHFRNQCPNDKKEANVAVDHSDDDFLIYSMESNVDSWVMDSGASFHATHSREALWNLKEGDFGKVRLANDEVLDVTGMGDIELKTSVGSWTLKDLDELGHEVKFKNGQWKVVKGNLVIARGRKRGSLYMVSLPSEGVTVSEQKKNKIRFIESRGQKKVCFADGKPRVTGQIQVERVWNGSEKPVKGIHSSGSKGCALARIPRRQWVKKTSIPSVKVSPDYLPHMESVVCSQDIPGSGSSFQWEPVETENRSVADLAMTNVLELTEASTDLQEN